MIKIKNNIQKIQNLNSVFIELNDKSKFNFKNLKTDGCETNYNMGDVYFLNFWNGSKLYNKLKSETVICKKNIYEWSQNVTIYSKGKIKNFSKYLEWRKSYFNCKFNILLKKYSTNVNFNNKFILLNNDDEESHVVLEESEARKQILFDEYYRLIINKYRNELFELLDNLLIDNKDLIICGKNIRYNFNFDKNTYWQHFLNDKCTIETLNAYCLALTLFNIMENKISDTTCSNNFICEILYDLMDEAVHFSEIEKLKQELTSVVNINNNANEIQYLENLNNLELFNESNKFVSFLLIIF